MPSLPLLMNIFLRDRHNYIHNEILIDQTNTCSAQAPLKLYNNSKKIGGGGGGGGGGEVRNFPPID